MTTARNQDEPAAIARFLELILDDRASGQSRADSEYTSFFPGHERAIERELASLRGDEPEGLTIAGYRVVDELGRGGQGTVYLADDPVLPRRVALKVLQGLVNPAPGLFLRFRREVETMAGINHPGVCPIFAVGLDSGAPWVAMRHLEGESLQTVMRRSLAAGLLPKTRAEFENPVRLVARIARAVAAVHAAGVVHRDLKPANVMIEEDGSPVVLDFGLAQTDDSTLTINGDVLGSPAYMSPEQAGGQGTDGRTDVWSLGVVLYELLSLKRPFAKVSTIATLAALQLEEPTRPERLNPHIPRDIAVIIATAMERDLGRRYASAAALADDLEAWAERRPISARPASLALRTLRCCQRHPLATLAAVAATAVLTLGIVAVRAGMESNRLEAEQRVESAMADLEAAFVELTGGSPSRADALFTRAGATLPAREERLAGHALTLHRLGRNDEAIAMLEADHGAPVFTPVIEYLRGAPIDTTAQPGNSLDAFLRGVVALYDAHHASGDFDLAMQWLSTAVHSSDAPPALYRLQLLDAAGRAERHDVARGIAHGLRMHWPKSPVVLLLAGNDALGAVKSDPEFVMALRQLASERSQSRDYASAVQHFEKALAVDAFDPTTQLEFGRTLIAMHEFRALSPKSIQQPGQADPLARAEDLLQQALVLAPNDPAILAALEQARALNDAETTPLD